MNIIGKYNQLSPNSRVYLLFLSFFWLYGFCGAFWARIGAVPDKANTVMLFVLAMLCHSKWKNLIRYTDVLLYLIIVLLYFISSIIYPISKELVISHSFEVLLVAVPFFFVGLIFKNEEYQEWLLLLSRLAIIINIIFTLLFSSSQSVVEEDMHRAYMLLPSVLYILAKLFERYRLMDLLFFILGFLMESSFGTRGPFVCILFFAVAYLFFFKEWKRKWITRVFLVIIAFALFSLSQDIAGVMIMLLGTYGQSTRIFDSMLDQSLLNYENSNGRNEIQEELLNLLNNDESGVGFGLFSDRIFSSFGFSSHNIIVELWFSFGYYIGSALLLIIIVLFIRFFIKAKDNSTRIFGLVFFTVSFVKLMFSDCFILDGYLFFLIGYCVNALRVANNKFFKESRPRSPQPGIIK